MKKNGGISAWRVSETATKSYELFFVHRQLETVRAIIRFRHEHEDLAADADFEAFEIPGEPHALVYRRGSLYLCVNPSDKAIRLPEDIAEKLEGKCCVFAIGSKPDAAGCLPSQSFAVFGAR